MAKDGLTGLVISCWGCGNNDIKETQLKNCINCGAYCCSDSCLNNHECDDEDGQNDEEEKEKEA
jgi:hypothetical protein